jgi:PncC family amidohydrolase
MSTKQMAQEVVHLMATHDMTLCFAESCTAGGIPKVITSIPGASRVLLGGVIAYHPSALASAIQVSEVTLLKEGVVSENVTDMLAEAGLRQFAADVCVATTGYLGPFQNDRPNHHEGWVVVRDRAGEQLHAKLRLDGRREANRQKMLRTALEFTLLMVKRRINTGAG